MRITPSNRPLGSPRLLLSLAALLLGLETAQSAVCTIRLLGKNYDLHYVQPSGGVYPRFNALSERVEYDLEEFGTILASTAAGVIGGSTAATFGIHSGQSALDPDREAGAVRSEAEDISPDGRFVIGWRQERPGFGDRPPRAFLYSNDGGFQFLDDIYPAVRELATRPYPPPDGPVEAVDLYLIHTRNPNGPVPCWPRVCRPRPDSTSGMFPKRWSPLPPSWSPWMPAILPERE